MMLIQIQTLKLHWVLMVDSIDRFLVRVEELRQSVTYYTGLL